MRCCQPLLRLARDEAKSLQSAAQAAASRTSGWSRMRVSRSRALRNALGACWNVLQRPRCPTHPQDPPARRGSCYINIRTCPRPAFLAILPVASSMDLLDIDAQVH
eukprot:6388542-Pyramimonas_sp.AAC.1